MPFQQYYFSDNGSECLLNSGGPKTVPKILKQQEQKCKEWIKKSLSALMQDAIVSMFDSLVY